jgi:hypothetical protein
MRPFGSPGYRLSMLTREAKILYSVFCLFALAAYVVSFLYYEDLMGGDIGAAAYYAGGALKEAARAPGAGPAIDLPAEAAHPARDPISYRHLLEVTHFHLFTAPLFLLVIAHLFLLTGLSSGAKLAWTALACLSTALHLAAPWLVRYGGAAAAPLFSASGLGMAASYLFMTGSALVAMWCGGRARPDSSPP